MTDENQQTHEHEEHKSEDALKTENREGMTESQEKTALETPLPASTLNAIDANSTTTAVHVSPADREETEEEARGEKVPGIFEKKKVEYHITPSPFSDNAERELFARDPEAYQKQKLAPATVAEINEEDRAIIDGPGTRTDAVPGTEAHDALKESRTKEAMEAKRQREEAEKK